MELHILLFPTEVLYVVRSELWMLVSSSWAAAQTILGEKCEQIQDDSPFEKVYKHKILFYESEQDLTTENPRLKLNNKLHSTSKPQHRGRQSNSGDNEQPCPCTSNMPFVKESSELNSSITDISFLIYELNYTVNITAISHCITSNSSHCTGLKKV